MLKGDSGKLDLWNAGVSTWRSVVSNDVGIWWKRNTSRTLLTTVSWGHFAVRSRTALI